MDKKKSNPLIVFLTSLLWAGDSPFRKPLLTGGLSVAWRKEAGNTSVWIIVAVMLICESNVNYANMKWGISGIRFLFAY